jgi:O-antigen/teichoic acid export membrane protein
MKDKKVSKILKNIVVMAGSSAVAQILIIAVSPLITRIYTPSSFGVYTYIISISTIIIQLSMMKYETAIIPAKTEKEVNILIKICLGLLIIVTIVSLIFLTIFLFTKNNLTKEMGLIMYSAIPIAFFTAFTNLLNSINNRYQNYKLIANCNIARASSQSIGQVGLGLLKFGSLGLIISHIVTVILISIMQLKYTLINFSKVWKVTFKEIKLTLIDNKQYPLYSMPIGLIVILSTSVITFFIEDLYGLEQVGQYSLTYRLLALPIVVLGQNIASVFFRSASIEYEEKGNFFKLYKKFLLIIFVFCTPIWIVLRYFSEEIFALVFGNEWRMAGVYTSYLATMYILKFITVSMAHSFVILNKQYLNLIGNLGTVICVIGTYLICKIGNLDIETFFSMLGNSSSLVYIIICVIMYLVVNKNKEGKIMCDFKNKK